MPAQPAVTPPSSATRLAPSPRGEPSAPPSRGAGQSALDAIPWWRRFDIRLAALFGGGSLLIVVAAGLFAYHLIVDAKLDFFRKRLESLALTLANTIEADAIPGLDRRADGGAAWRQEWRTRLMHIVENEPDIDSIYILQPTERPAQLRFLLDASKVSRVAEPGELYDASELPYMLRAFTAVQVEDQVYADDFGATQSSYAPLRTSKGEVVGIVGVDVLAVRIAETRGQVLVFCIGLFGLTAGGLALIAFLLRRRIKRRISRVLAATEAISAGRFDAPAAMSGDDEFALLGRRIDDMAH